MKVTTDACLFGAWCAEEIMHSTFPVKNVLDIGAGTGLLSLIIAQKNNMATIDAVEIEKEAAAQASKNIAASPWQDQIHLHTMDIRCFHPALKYDCIISNPPFYENELISVDSKKNVAHHSTHLELEPLLHFIKNNLTSTGTFYLLLPYKRKKEVENLCKKKELYIHKLVLVRQSVAHSYFRILIAGSIVKQPETETSELSVWNEQQQYTPEFVHLLKDYYLYL